MEWGPIQFVRYRGSCEVYLMVELEAVWIGTIKKVKGRWRWFPSYETEAGSEALAGKRFRHGDRIPLGSSKDTKADACELMKILWRDGRLP